MKIILVIFLFITSTQCGVLRDSSNMGYGQLIRVTDSFDKGNVTFVTEILLDVSKDEKTYNIYNTTPIFPGDSGDDSEYANFESGTSYYYLLVTPGSHVWDVKFPVSEAAEEVSRVNGIVEAAAIKIGQLVGKNCTTGEIAVICYFYINVDETNQTLPKTEVEVQKNTVPVDGDELKNIPFHSNLTGDANYILFAHSETFVGGCPPGTARAEDKTCVEIIN